MTIDTPSYTDRQVQIEAAEDSMVDYVIIQDSSVSSDAYNDPSFSYSDGIGTKCGYLPSVQKEMYRESKTVVLSDGRIRLPLNTPINEKCRLKLTQRYGESLATPLVFDILSLSIGHTCIICDLQRVSH